MPKVVAPSLNVTVPDGVPEAGELALTVAVNVTDCPDTDGLADEVTEVVVFPLVILKEDEVAPVKPVEAAVKV